MKVYSPMQGRLVSLDKVPDPVFAQKMVGDGIAIIPNASKILAPVSGKVTSIFPTKHAIGIESEDGLEILIHIGIDTVNLKGEHFIAHVEQGDAITIGDVLLEVDFEAIKEAGYPIITPIIIINNGENEALNYNVEKDIDYLDLIIEGQ